MWKAILRYWRPEDRLEICLLRKKEKQHVDWLIQEARKIPSTASAARWALSGYSLSRPFPPENLHLEMLGTEPACQVSCGSFRMATLVTLDSHGSG